MCKTKKQYSASGIAFLQHCQSKSNADDMPAYQYLAFLIADAIEQGIWSPGDIIPPERFFADEFALSPGTVKRAMIDLVGKGLLYRHRGRGTFVADSGYAREFRRHHLFLQNFDSKEAKNKIVLVSKAIIPPIREVNRNLSLGKDEQLIEITRKILENDKTAALSTAYYGRTRFQRLMDVLNLRFERAPLFVIIEEEFKIQAHSSNELYRIAMLRKAEAELFGVAAGKPALLVKTLSFDKNAAPFEYRTSYIVSDRKYLFRKIIY